MDMESYLSKLFLFGITAILSALAYKTIYALYISPLRHVPGPRLAALTEYWMIFIDLKGDRTSTIHRLHLQYGAAVRIGPTEVSFSDTTSVGQIYSQQTSFMKAPLYENFTIPPMGIFGMREKDAHSQRRRYLSHTFSQTSLLNTEPLIIQKVQKLRHKICTSLGDPLDMLSLFRLLSFDIVGELFLGQDFGGLDSVELPQFLHDMDNLGILGGIQFNFPWIYKIIPLVPVARVHHFYASRHRMVEYGRNALESYTSQYGRESGRRDLLTKILSTKDEQTAPLSDLEIYTEIGNLVFAGTDTTSTTLTYLFWELARNAIWQRRLRDELSTTFGDSDPEAVTWTALQKLPILDAVVNEALRLHPAVPASLPRTTPMEGRVLNGYQIPGGTIVSAQCYTTQRDERVFPDANHFLPERWLKIDHITSEMKELFMPFSKGTRACLGKTLALMELKLITAVLLKSTNVKLGPDTTEDCMLMKDHFLLMPKGGKCDIIFEAVN